MIWFNCRECGKKHGRPESSVGSLTFCTCGHGNTVPWESTAQPDPIVNMEALPTVPPLAPLKFEPTASGSRLPPPLPPSVNRPRRRDDPRARQKPHDPAFCLNHNSRPSQTVCVDCQQGFCEDCLVYIEAKPLCGPCKNRRVKALHQPPPTSQLALVSVLLAMFMVPFAFCLYAMGPNFQTHKLTLFALLPQFVALAVGIRAVRKTEANRRLGGQALALSGILTAGFGAFWTIFLTMYATRLWG